jgi:hypothetical protein
MSADQAQVCSNSGGSAAVLMLVLFLVSVIRTFVEMSISQWRDKRVSCDALCFYTGSVHELSVISEAFISAQDSWS